MGIRILIRAGMKQHRGVLTGIFVLILLVSLALGMVLTLWVNAGNHVEQGLEQAGFGELTAWVSGGEDWDGHYEEITSLPEIDKADAQQVIFTNYTVLNQESDSEGQLIVYESGRERYRFFTDDLTGCQSSPERIRPGEVYVSPSLVSMFGVSIGDEINFPIARSRRNLSLTITGFYEDPVMGSSMIGMKGFLVSEEDYQSAVEIINNSGIDALAREGAMLHIFSSIGLPVAELNVILNEQTGLAQFTEFIHSWDAIAGFMLIL